jgi:ATP synthase protein I
MTTAAQTRAPGSGPGVAGRVVRWALVATLVLGILLGLVARLAAGGAALAGVLTGTALVCGFFGLGTVVLLWVSRVSPAMTLLVGLLTYSLQVIVLGLAFAVLQASGLMGSTIDGGWLGGTVIAGTLVWLAIQVTLSLRTRQLYYELPEQDGVQAPSGTPQSVPARGAAAGPAEQSAPRPPGEQASER